MVCDLLWKKKPGGPAISDWVFSLSPTQRSPLNSNCCCSTGKWTSISGLDMGIPIPRALHGGQSFRYHRIACAGDVMTFNSEIVDIYDKKNGALEFIVQDVHITDQNAEPVADFCRTIVIRNG